MSFNDSNNMVMPVSPMYGNNGGGWGDGFGGNGAWWLLVLLFALGNNGWGNGYGAGGAMPYMLGNNTDNAVQRGFDQSAVMSGIGDLATAVGTGFSNTQQAICNSTASVTAAVNNGFANAEIANNGRQIANMQQQFANQTAMNTGFNTIASQLAQCCCDNRLATANLNSTILSENCADRAALSDGIRDILTNQNAGVQRILDVMCQDKIDAKNEKIAELQNQLTMANLAASQNAQTARILADNAAQTTALEQYLNPVPIPAYPVQNPNCCNNNWGWNNGCGCNG